ncbi:BCS1-like ATPase-like protein [Pleomassaria siparia CBS 279.74]|uniref:BCS1-like ATPase-like protein n=1 Tax=Pleomassaria siparia CBS 279.74 TaxID=1314801 RepID=A0A6G1JRB9_9PLEO|nr:BCS1-like ATPase-like protein [Pleomassaria siparia CBS 279.74]
MGIMDFTRLSSINFDTDNSNSTLSSLPSAFLEALIPGYGIFSQIIFRVFGFDVGLIVPGCLLVFGLSKGAQFFYQKGYNLFSSYFMCNIQIEDDDGLFSQIIEWIAEQRMTKVSRDLKAVTTWAFAHDESNEDADASDDDVLDESGIFNFEKWASNIPPRYEPNFGSDRFWYDGRMFFFSRTRRERQARSIWRQSEEQVLTISCVGRSTEPIKELLNMIKRWTLTKDNKMTAIYRPTPKDYEWDRQSLRPSRPMSTVSLNQEEKANIVIDINEFLHPASSRWYAARGIPYRRGYLFHGPPGTGKTSLSFALAGIFGLEIYCISLMEVGLTESNLNNLFGSLPRRCIVLLEDIDSAGLRRPEDAAELPERSPDMFPSNSGTDDGSITKISLPTAVAKTSGPPPGGFKSLISLSGLLNAIDGVASHEGRVLIMTTNHAERLDGALIRPGRVDLQVPFTLATRDQSRDIFTRMYSTEYDQKPNPSTPSTSEKPRPPPGSHEVDAEFFQLLAQPPMLDIVEPARLKEMADVFASEIPEKVFSPAQIQGFLLMRKREPSRALRDVAEWRDRTVEDMSGERKILKVQ